MNKNHYEILLDNNKIGMTALEKADVPMGVVFGRIELLNVTDGYTFFKNYCRQNLIGITDYKKDKIISTRNISNLKVVDEDGTEVKGVETSVSGQGENDFEITIEGIPSSLFLSKFPYHIDRYKELLKQNIDKDNIIEVGIDNLERLYIKPQREKFPLIYRTATEVHWDNNGNFLHSPKPKEWTYFDWYKHIVGVVETECNCKLVLMKETKWSNIPDELKRQILGK